MAAPPTVVIKVGGSLLGWTEFPARLRAYLDDSASDRILLIVGGGRAADFVRELDSVHGIGEKRSHGLALRALDLTAHAAAALVPGLTVVTRPDDRFRAWERGLVPVLAPRWFLENVDRPSGTPLPESWAVTTDSIAARVAVTLGAEELRLLKSVGLGGVSDRAEAASRGLVDPEFPECSSPLRRLAVVNLRASPPSTDSLG
ncbi:MAG: uridylate kinase [Planctomycetia bacterium]|nr:uridylate kinase [Planctomycetia bacterium]